MDALRRNNEPLYLWSYLRIYLAQLSDNVGLFTIEQLIPALEGTTTLTYLNVNFDDFESTPENNRRVIEPLCRCIANLRRHNQNHTLRKLTIFNANIKFPDFKPFLVAAKQFGIHCLEFNTTLLPIHSLVEFCRDNNHLKVLRIFKSILFDDDSTISVTRQHDGPQNSSAILTLDKLVMRVVEFENSTVANKFLNFIVHVTYPALYLENITVNEEEKKITKKFLNFIVQVHFYLGETIVRGEVNEEEKKTTRLRIVSELIKPSVQRLTLSGRRPIEVVDAIEACATVTQILLSEENPASDFPQNVQAIATRNRELARFVANPRGYPGGDLLALMRQLDSSPTGRYMLVRCFPGIPSFFVINKSTDSSTAGLKKKY